MQIGGSSEFVPTQEEKSQALLVWVLAIFIGFISGLIFYMIAKDKPFVKACAAQSLALSICLIIIQIVLFVVMIAAAVVLGPFALVIYLGMLAAGLFGLVMNIMGAMRANEGIVLLPPVTSNFAKQWFKV
ncbi:MAG TPA: DUF4870 domain-containing protein [Fimbriimonadaceae bacterium]|nr:DUF4870 domain-containing protein [Fimbriimonadaceae bacterium]